MTRWIYRWKPIRISHGETFLEAFLERGGARSSCLRLLSSSHLSEGMVSFLQAVGVVPSSLGFARASGEMVHAAVGFLVASVPMVHLEIPEDEDPKTMGAGVSNVRPPTPAEGQSAAVDRLRRSEAAIDALGACSEEALFLEGVLAHVQRGSSLAPVGERLASTLKYVEGCQKRLLAAEDAVKVAISSRDQAAAEL